MDRKDIALAYMVFGGAPYYWSLLDRGESLSQNIDRLFFGARPELAEEFERLCLQHTRQIKSALGIAGVETSESSWRCASPDPDVRGAQIDLVIQRGDSCGNITHQAFDAARGTSRDSLSFSG